MSRLPNSVLYVKNGRGGEWWEEARRHDQIHAGWRHIPAELIQKADIDAISRDYRTYYPNGTTQDLNALKRLLDHPSRHLWVTVEDGYLWWCLVGDQISTSGDIEGGHGHFWLSCAKPWSNQSIGGKPLSIIDLPGGIQKVAGFRATVCKPEAWEEILNVIQDRASPAVMVSAKAREDYRQAIQALVRALGAKDFEHLIDLILARSGWERISKTGGIQEGIDLAVENPAMNERVFVQIKSSADQNVLDDYVGRYKNRGSDYDKMIFVVHTPKGELKADDPEVLIWKADDIAGLVVRLGLGERLEAMRGVRPTPQ